MTEVDGPPPAFFEALLEDDPRELYETAPCGYVSIDSDRTIIKVNQTFCRWTGHRSDELVGRRTFLDLLTVGDRIYWETNIGPALEMQGKGREIALDILAASGDRLPVLLNLLRVEGPGSGNSVVRIAVFDARERRAYERELLDARRQAEAAAETARQLAETLQRTLLPPSLPDIEGIELGGVYHAAGDGSIVGGDFYDVFEISHDAWGVVLGDVCGKGIGAAVDTALARYTVRAAAIRTRSPTKVLGELHDAMERSAEGFCTAIYLRIRKRGDGVRMSISVGGHHLPLLVGPDGDVNEFGRPGALLGMLGPPRLHGVDRLLHPGESLVLYTDGVIEARRDDDEFFGEHRLHDILRTMVGRSPQEIAEAIRDQAIEFQHGIARDDIAVLVLHAPEAQKRQR